MLGGNGKRLRGGWYWSVDEVLRDGDGNLEWVWVNTYYIPIVTGPRNLVLRLFLSYLCSFSSRWFGSALIGWGYVGHTRYVLGRIGFRTLTWKKGMQCDAAEARTEKVGSHVECFP